MEIAVVAITGASMVIAVVSAVVAWRARGDSNRSATAAEAAEHRASTPHLRIEPEGDVPREAIDVVYRVYNLDGPDLTSVVVHRPVVGPGDAQVVYPVAATGVSGWDDTAEIGPIALGGYGRFTLALGSADPLPELHAKVVCTTGSGRPWQVSLVLDTPRGPATLRAERERYELEASERRAADRQALARAGGVHFRVRGGGGEGYFDPPFRLTGLRVTVRNDTDTIALDVRLVVGEFENFVWHPQDDDVLPGQTVDEVKSVHRLLPNATVSESCGAALVSYPSRLEFTMGGRRFVRRGDGAPEFMSSS